jgi:hypothetical protein
MRDLPLDDGVRARQADALSLKPQLREDEMRRRRADVDADRPQAQPLGRDVAGVIGIMPVVNAMLGVMRVR